MFDMSDRYCIMSYLEQPTTLEIEMKLTQEGSNQTALHLPNGTVVFFSYETPVAAMLPSGEHLRTEQYYSVTTSKHINRWLGGVEARPVEQGVLNALVGE